MQEVRREKSKETSKEVSFTILPIAPKTSSEEEKKAFMEVQLQMVTNSINHEYACQEYDDTEDVSKKEELSAYMDQCINDYEEAREKLREMSPLNVDEFERDLFSQKKKYLPRYKA